MSGLAGFLLAENAAAYSRRKPKDRYDIAFVLLHNEADDPEQAVAVVLERFEGEINGPIRTGSEDLNAKGRLNGGDALCRWSPDQRAQMFAPNPSTSPGST